MNWGRLTVNPGKLFWGVRFWGGNQFFQPFFLVNSKVENCVSSKYHRHNIMTLSRGIFLLLLRSTEPHCGHYRSISTQQSPKIEGQRDPRECVEESFVDSQMMDSKQRSPTPSPMARTILVSLCVITVC